MRGNEINEVMGDASPLTDRNLRGRDFYALVNLYRVAINDLAVWFQSDSDSERTFTGGGWTNDSYDWFDVRAGVHAAENSTR
jgi:hypothetical protein